MLFSAWTDIGLVHIVHIYIYIYIYVTCALHVNLYIFTNNGRTMTMTNDRLDLSSEGTPDIDKRVNPNRNYYPVVRPRWISTPGLTDRLIVGRNVTLEKTGSSETLVTSYRRTTSHPRIQYSSSSTEVVLLNI
jgi:hypothetical protein